MCQAAEVPEALMRQVSVMIKDVSNLMRRWQAHKRKRDIDQAARRLFEQKMAAKKLVEKVAAKMAAQVVTKPHSPDKHKEKQNKEQQKTHVWRQKPTAAFTDADVGQTVSITGDAVTVNGVGRAVQWHGARHHNCSGKIGSVVANPQGSVVLEDGEEFENPALAPLVVSALQNQIEVHGQVYGHM